MKLRVLNDGDVAAIRQWPVYPGDLAQMDYALRSRGWLEEFPAHAGALRFGAVEGNELIGFTLLMPTGAADAEFRIALRADRTGQGWGETIVALTLHKAFAELGLSRVHLIVRKNNTRGLRLYRRLGFTDCGECRQEIQGVVTDFLTMEIGCRQYARGRTHQGGDHDHQETQGVNRH